MTLDDLGEEGLFGALGLSVEELDLGGVDAKVDLTVGLDESADGLRLILLCDGVVRRRDR